MCTDMRYFGGEACMGWFVFIGKLYVMDGFCPFSYNFSVWWNAAKSTIKNRQMEHKASFFQQIGWFVKIYEDLDVGYSHPFGLFVRIQLKFRLVDSISPLAGSVSCFPTNNLLAASAFRVFRLHTTCYLMSWLLIPFIMTYVWQLSFCLCIYGFLWANITSVCAT